MHDSNRNTARQDSVVQWLTQLDSSSCVPSPIPDHTGDNAERHEAFSRLRPPKYNGPRDPSTVHRRNNNVTSWNQKGYTTETTTLSRIWDHGPEYSYDPTPRRMANFNHARADSCNIGTQFPPEKTFERKPRRKTRKDRYYPRRQETAEGGAGEKTRKSRDARLKKRRHGRKGLEDQFMAPNVSQNRLTLTSNFDVGLFARGRASSPVNRRELPDLSFSEMKFLSRPNKPSQAINVTDAEKSGTSNQPQIKDISEYFSRKQPGRKHKSASSRVMEQPSLDAPKNNDQPPSIRGAPTRVSPATPLALQPRLDLIKPQYSKRTSRSTTKYTWSETNAEVAPRHEHRADGHCQAPIAGPRTTAQYSPLQNTASKEDKWGRSSPLTSNFEYDPFIVSKTHDMMFRNAYITEAQDDTALLTDQMCYTLKELQTLADRYIPMLTEPEDSLIYPSKKVELTQGDENHCQFAQKNIFHPAQVAGSRKSEGPGNLTQAVQALDELEPVGGGGIACPNDNLSPRPAVDGNHRFGTGAVNISREVELTSGYATGRPLGHVNSQRNYPQNVFLPHTPARNEGSRRERPLAPTPQHFWGSRFQELSVPTAIAVDQKRANITRLEFENENLIPTTPSIGDCTDIDFEPIFLSGPGSLHGYFLNDNCAHDASNRSLGYSEWTHRSRPSPLAQQRNNGPVDLQRISESQCDNNSSSTFQPYDPVRRISPLKQRDFSSVSTPNFPFWRPNKLY